MQPICVVADQVCFGTPLSNSHSGAIVRDPDLYRSDFDSVNAAGFHRRIGWSALIRHGRWVFIDRYCIDRFASIVLHRSFCIDRPASTNPCIASWSLGPDRV
jgi:hypothetical protein